MDLKDSDGTLHYQWRIHVRGHWGRDPPLNFPYLVTQKYLSVYFFNFFSTPIFKIIILWVSNKHSDWSTGNDFEKSIFTMLF